MPIAHIFGVAIMNDLLCTPNHLADATRLVQMRWFEPERFMALIESIAAPPRPPCPRSWRCCCTIRGPPSTTCRRSRRSSAAARRCRSSWRRPSCAATPARIREVYGLTEATGLGTANRRSEPFRPGSAGRAYDNIELAIFDDNDRPLPAGKRGEICIRGRVVMQGYTTVPTKPRPMHSRRLAAHRRHRLPGRRRVPVRRRPQEGHDHSRRREHLSGRARGRVARASGSGRSGRGGRARRGVRRKRGGVRRGPGRALR